MKHCFSKVKKNFGFGFMRLPMIGEEVDYEQTCRMVDMFMEKGFTYFDTAHGYIGGKSELAIRDCVARRYNREDFVLVNKLSPDHFNSEGDIRPLLEKQLEACGVDYFDFYLMHCQNADLFKKYKKCRAYETAFDLKKEGKVKYVGFSFHDKAEVLDQILTEYPEIEVVQIQFNYLDYEDPVVESRKCYEVCVKHNKPVIVMEPVRGGRLINIPPRAKRIFDELQGGSIASYAIRYAASFENVFMVLSGMSNMEQVEDNVSFMKEFQPLTEKEYEAIEKVCTIIKGQDLIPCTNCKYCVEGCPKDIAIPDIFADRNAKKEQKDVDSQQSYMAHTKDAGKASDCIKCGKCEKACPQHLPIRELLEEVAKEFEEEVVDE